MSSSTLPATLKQPLTPDEQRVYGAAFRQLDTENLGVVTGEAARSTFEKSGLPPVTLGEIWQLADPTNLGFLTQHAFCIALRLIGHVQTGVKPDKALIDYAGPLASFQSTASATTGGMSGLNSSMAGSPAMGNTVGVSTTGGSGLQPLAPQFTSLPPLTNHDISKFSQLFAKNAPTGTITGTQARSIFLKAKLPTNVLGQIWGLADRNNAGQLTREEFVVAMYLIQGSINGSIKQLPSTLPTYVWDQVKASQSPAMTGSSASFSPQLTGARPDVSRVPSSFNNASNDWVIAPQKKAQFDSIFEGLDKNQKGVLGPEEVAPFLMTSKLSQDTLASIWDLADIHNTGEFTKDEFAIAMFLVQKKIAGAELPEVVPDSLLPGSHPALQQQNTQSFAQPIQQQPIQSQQSRPQIPSRETKPKSALSDLVDLNDAFSTPSPPVSDSRNVSNSTVNYTPTGSNAPKAFAPSSNFGQGLMEKQSPAPVASPTTSTAPASAPVAEGYSQPPAATQSRTFSPQQQSFPPPPAQIPSMTGSRVSSTASTGFDVAAGLATGAAGAAVASRGFSSRNDDLLADTNPEVSGKLSQATTDMANLSNQIGSLTNQTSQLHEKRNRAERELAKITSLKQDIEGKLAKLRAAYDQEVKQTEQVESLLITSRSETEQLRKDASVAEAQYNQIQTQLQSLQAELGQSQRENASLKERLAALNAEQIEINNELERVRGEVKQSKGLVAINSKQLNVSQVQASGIREEIENLLASTRELDTHHETYTQKQFQLETAKKQVDEFEQSLLTRQQQLEQGHSDLSTREQDLQAKVQEQQQRESAILQEEERLQQMFASLQERQRQHDLAEELLEQQQYEYAQKLHQFTEKRIQDVTTGYSGQSTPESEDRDVATQEPVSKGTLAGALSTVGAAAGVAAYTSTSAKSESEKDTEFDSPVAGTTENTTSVTSDQYDQFPGAQQFNHLDIQRPESTTSSVQNNAPQSVRGEDLEETPNIDAIVEEPALAADVLSKDYNPSSVRTAEGESSGVGSFEIVDEQKSDDELTMGEATGADTTVTKSADAIEQSIPGAWAETAPLDSIVPAEVPEAVAEGEKMPSEIPENTISKEEVQETIPETIEEAVPEQSTTSLNDNASDPLPSVKDIDAPVSESTSGFGLSAVVGSAVAAGASVLGTSAGTSEHVDATEDQVRDAEDDFDGMVPAEEDASDNQEPFIADGSTTTPNPNALVESEFPPIQELDIDESDSDDEEFHETSEALPSPMKKVIPPPQSSFEAATSSPLVNAAAGLTGSSGNATFERDAFADDFEGLEEAQEVQDDEDFEPQNFNEELEGTTFFGADELHHQQASFEDQEEPVQQENEEWEQIFAGFGNQPPPQQSGSFVQTQPVPAVPTTSGEGSSRAIPPRIATTPRSLAVQELTGMGFSEEEALKALEKEKWNLEAATNHLLDNA